MQTLAGVLADAQRELLELLPASSLSGRTDRRVTPIRPGYFLR